MSTSTLADKNNNPGNIRISDDNWQGSNGSNAGFVNFNHPEYGVRAFAKNLYTSQEKHGNNSVASIISRWAPPSENETDVYINKVAKDLGVNSYADLGSLRDNPQLTRALIKSMAHMEGASVGNDGKYTDGVLTNGVALANGKTSDEIVLSQQDTDHNADLYPNTAPLGEEDETSFQGNRGNRGNVASRKAAQTSLLTSNWMSTVDSPTYKWTLYIVNNEVWNDPNVLHAGDSAVISANKAKIIAEQGVTTEFSLDNFMMLSTVSPGQAHGHTTPGIMQFDIFETLGFTFLDRTLRAGIEIGMPGSLHMQNYILKLEFLGRDPNTSASIKYDGVFFYPIKLNQIRSSTGPEGTRYNIIAWSMIKHAQTYAVTSVDTSIKNIKTVGDFANELATAYNKTFTDQMHPQWQQNGEVPLQSIEIAWHESTRGAGIKFPSGHPKAGQIANIGDFNLKVKKWGATSNADKGGGQSVDVNNADLRTAMIESETALGAAIADKIQMNCPEWADYVLKTGLIGITPSIVVDLKVEYTAANNQYQQASISGSSRANGGQALPKGTPGGQPIHLIFTVKIHLNYTTATDANTQVNNFNDTTIQTEKMNNLPIEKAYTFLYSGLNTEVLNYNIDIESLFTVITAPADGIYSTNMKESYAPSIRSKQTKTKYLEDMPHNQTTHNFNNVFNSTVKPASPHEQTAGETQATNIEKANIASNMAKREYDAFGFEMEIKGDPYWMGNMQVSVNGTLTVPDYGTQDAMIAFIQYNPNVDDLLEHQRKGPVDVISSGVYKLTSISSRFQEGRFTQTLTGYKDVTTNTSIIMPQLIQLTGEA